MVLHRHFHEVVFPDGGILGIVSPSASSWHSKGHHLHSSFSGDSDDKDAPEGTNKAHSEAWLRASPPVQEYSSNLQKEVNALQSKWRDGITKLFHNYEEVHGLDQSRQEGWLKHKSNLQRSCEKLRDAIDRITEAKAVCEKAQMDEGSGLPALFKVSAKDPKRFKSLGPIKGCVRVNAETGETQYANCTCETGNLGSGCLDAVSMGGNTLSCSHILNKELANLPLADYFKDGGACRINSREPWNAPIVPKDVFVQMAEASKMSIGIDATAFLSLVPQCAALCRHHRVAQKHSRGDLISFLATAHDI